MGRPGGGEPTRPRKDLIFSRCCGESIESIAACASRVMESVVGRMASVTRRIASICRVNTESTPACCAGVSSRSFAIRSEKRRRISGLGSRPRGGPPPSWERRPPCRRIAPLRRRGGSSRRPRRRNRGLAQQVAQRVEAVEVVPVGHAQVAAVGQLARLSSRRCGRVW